MRMTDLPGRIVRPLGDVMKTKEQVAITRTEQSNALRLEIGGSMEVSSENLARRLNQRFGLGMFSNKKINGKNHIIRNK